VKEYLKPARAVLVICALATSAPVRAQDATSPPPNMPFRYGLGYERFQENCAQCHGPSLGGTDEGPPLLHQFYVPSHHGDAAFYRAIQAGSKQHHWNFGDMPPVAGVDENEARTIVEFVRWFQQESGLF